MDVLEETYVTQATNEVMSHSTGVLNQGTLFVGAAFYLSSIYTSCHRDGWQGNLLWLVEWQNCRCEQFVSRNGSMDSFIMIILVSTTQLSILWPFGCLKYSSDIIKENFKEKSCEVDFCEATFGAWLCMVLKLGRFGQQIRNTWKVLKCGAGEGWRRSVGPITWEMKKCYLESMSRGISYTK